MTGMSARAAQVAGVFAGVVGAAAYSSFLLGPLAHSRLSAVSSFPSEQEASGQPYAGLFRLSDIVSGLLIVLLAAMLYRLLPRERPLPLGCLLIAVMGAASVADGATTMGCAPSLNAACAKQDSTILGLLSQTFESHTLSGLAGFLCGAAGMFLIGVAVRRWSPAWGGASVYLACALGLVGLVDLVLLAADHWFGLAERARALVVSVWLLGGAGFFLRLSRADVRRTNASSVGSR